MLTWPGACGADFAHLVRVGSVGSSAVRSSPFLLERYSETLRKPIPLTVALQCPPPPMFSCWISHYCDDRSPEEGGGLPSLLLVRLIGAL